MTANKDRLSASRTRAQLLAAIPTNREKFTISETAKLLHRPEQQIYNLIYSGELPARNIATRPELRAMYRILRSDLVKYIEAQPEGSR